LLLGSIAVTSIYGGIFATALFRLSVGAGAILAFFAMIPAFVAVHLALSFAGCVAGDSMR